jgi:hypothetical protein
LGPRADGVTRQTGFDITAASEVMAMLAPASSLAAPPRRLGRIIGGYTPARLPVTAEESATTARSVTIEWVSGGRTVGEFTDDALPLETAQARTHAPRSAGSAREPA